MRWVLNFLLWDKKEGKGQMALYVWCILKTKYSFQSNRGQTGILTRFILHTGWIWWFVKDSITNRMFLSIVMNLTWQSWYWGNLLMNWIAVFFTWMLHSNTPAFQEENYSCISKHLLYLFFFLIQGNLYCWNKTVVCFLLAQAASIHALVSQS